MPACSQQQNWIRQVHVSKDACNPFVYCPCTFGFTGIKPPRLEFPCVAVTTRAKVEGYMMKVCLCVCRTRSKSAHLVTTIAHPETTEVANHLIGQGDNVLTAELVHPEELMSGLLSQVSAALHSKGCCHIPDHASTSSQTLLAECYTEFVLSTCLSSLQKHEWGVAN